MTVLLFLMTGSVVVPIKAIGLGGLGWLVDPFTLPRQVRTASLRRAAVDPSPSDELPVPEPAIAARS
jgi:hypothetical protein